MEYIKILDELLLSDTAFDDLKLALTDDEFRNWLFSILPEIEDCEKQKQDNPWHIYGCLDHILMSVEEMNRQTKNLPENDRRLLAYVMLYHDIGKPATYIRRFGKAYGREIDSFFGHNKKSAEIVKRTIRNFDFDENQAKIIEKLVLDHDIFMFISEENDGNKFHKVLTKDLVQKQVKELDELGNGTQLMKYLIMVGRSDNKAQNPEMTKKSLKMLDKMDTILKSIEPEELTPQKQ